MATHVRVISGFIQDGKFEEAKAILQDQIIPALQALEGYEGSDLLISGNKFTYQTRWLNCPVGLAGIDAFYANLRDMAVTVLDGEPEHIRYELSLNDVVGGAAV
jgi:hypothetical protein